MVGELVVVVVVVQAWNVTATNVVVARSNIALNPLMIAGENLTDMARPEGVEPPTPDPWFVSIHNRPYPQRGKARRSGLFRISPSAHSLRFYINVETRMEANFS